MHHEIAKRTVNLSVCGCALALCMIGVGVAGAEDVQYIWEAEFTSSIGTPPGDFSDLAEGDTVELTLTFNTDDAELLSPPRTDQFNSYIVVNTETEASFSIGLQAIELNSACTNDSAIVGVARSGIDDYLEASAGPLDLCQRGGAFVQNVIFTVSLPPDSIWADGELPTTAAEFTEFLNSFVLITIGQGSRGAEEEGLGGVATFWALTRFEIKPVVDCPGDANDDAMVNVQDLLSVINNWGSDGSGGGDVNDDDIVNVQDLLEVINNWGNAC